MKVLGLIADIGGTNARFGLATEDGFTREVTLKCKNYPGPVEAAKDYFDMIGVDGGTIKAGAFDVAGPITGDWFELTNHKWAFSFDETRKALGFDRLDMVNDFEAVALAIPKMDAKHIVKIGDNGERKHGQNIGVIGPGTGLGVAGLFWNGTEHIASPCEGGHVTVPAQTQRQFDVVQELLKNPEFNGHISAERVCSGQGIVNIYNALRSIEGRDDLPVRAKEDAELVTDAAKNGGCAISKEATDMFVEFLGVVSGNLALTLNAGGGVFIAGGIPEKLKDNFSHAMFRKSFELKGRNTDAMKQIPTYLIKHPMIAFEGLRRVLMRNEPA